MIILLLIIGAVAFFWTMVLMKPNRRRPLAIAVSALLIMIPVVLLSLNDLYHIGFTIEISRPKTHRYSSKFHRSVAKFRRLCYH